MEAEKETKKAYKQQLEDKTNQVVQLITSNTKLTREYERLKTSGGRYGGAPGDPQCGRRNGS